ncbi:hypothetical protein D7X74_29175 [Corallococcus sp. CA047B]|nr:hypothetical protein D7X74_29175 [Corallococcus sp. CA047B]
MVAGSKAAERLLLPALTHEDPEYIRAACMALLRSGTEVGVDSVLRTLTQGEQDARKEAQRALALDGGPALRREYCDSEQELRAVEPREALHSPDPAVREAALVLGLVRGQRIAWQACQQQLDARDAAGSTARLLLAVGGDDKDIERLKSLLQVSNLRADVLWALGFSGRLSAAEACLPWMHDKAFASIAAEAFCSIVGLKLEGPLVSEEGSGDEGFMSPEEDLDGDPRPGGEAALIAPHPEAVESWWARARKGFNPAERYFGGAPFSASGLVPALLSIPMRRRPPLALELLIRSQGRIAVEVRSWTHVQWEQLHAAQGESGRLKAQPFAAWLGG